MKNIQLSWFNYRKSRQREVRWFVVLMGIGLAVWISLSGGSSVAQQPSVERNESSEIESILVAQSAPEAPAIL